MPDAQSEALNGHQAIKFTPLDLLLRQAVQQLAVRHQANLDRFRQRKSAQGSHSETTTNELPDILSELSMAVSNLEQATAGDQDALNRINTIVSCENVCEDLTRIAGLKGVGLFTSVWKEVKLSGAATQEGVLQKARDRIRDAKPGSLTANLYEPYASVVHDSEAMATVFNSTGGEDQELVKRLKAAHAEFSRRLKELRSNGSMEQLAEAEIAAPEPAPLYRWE